MYLSDGLKVGNYIYLIECLSRCLISIHIPSGESKIEAYLPWKYMENKISMMFLNHDIIIHSPSIDHFLVYDCLNQQIKAIELQGIEADEVGFYYSNVLMDEDDFIVLPFKGRELRRYGINGELKFKDSQWPFAISRECGCDEKTYGNIRFDSACMAGNQIFFSLIYGNQNYLCRYELKQEKHLCKIIYHSKEIAIRGVYAYSDAVIFRRIFPDKTEIVLIKLDSDEKRTIIVDYPSKFEEDVYGNIHHLKGVFKNKILEIDGSNLKTCQEIYCFEQADVYIADGILFNALKNQILIPESDFIRKYSIETETKKIKKSSSYQEALVELFNSKCISEGRFRLCNLMEYLIEFHLIMEKKSIKQNKSSGELVWRTIQ